MKRFLFNGIVASDSDAPIYRWFGYSAVCPKQVRKALAEADGEGLVLEVNSPGGSALAGMEIRNILAAAAVPVTAVVQSYAASAASYAILTCSKVEMAPGSQMMLHRPSTCTAGNAKDHEESLQMLGSMYESLLDVYCARCGEKATREQLAEICDNETWLTAQKCVDLGLADGIWTPESADPRNMAAAFGLPDITVLRQRYAEAHKDPAPDPEPNTDPEPTSNWQQNAALAIEKARFMPV